MRYAVIARYPTGSKVEGDFSSHRAASQRRRWLLDERWKSVGLIARPLDTCVVGFEKRIEPGTEKHLRSKPQPATLFPMGV